MAYVERPYASNASSYHISINKSSFSPILLDPRASSISKYKPKLHTAYQPLTNRRNNVSLPSQVKNNTLFGLDFSSELRNFSNQHKSFSRYSSKSPWRRQNLQRENIISPKIYRKTFFDCSADFRIDYPKNVTRKTSLPDHSTDRILNRQYLIDVPDATFQSDNFKCYKPFNDFKVSERKIQINNNHSKRYLGFNPHIIEKPTVQSKYRYNPQTFKELCNNRSDYISTDDNHIPLSSAYMNVNTTNSPSYLKNSVSGILYQESEDAEKRGLLNGRYQTLQRIGKGSFGEVFKALDNLTGQYCAIKIVKDVHNLKKLAETEIDILNFLTKLDKFNEGCFSKLNDHFIFRGNTCMVFELLSTNLYEIIHRNNYKGFSTDLVKKFTRCILKCLDLMHRNKVIHCDLKPENILLTHPGFTNLKVVDFGSSCYDGQTIYTYIQSRFYRAPEVILRSDYGTSIDIWSLGCIIVELLTGTPLFPGENEHDQLACIMEVLGLPPVSLLQKSKKIREFFTNSGEPIYISDNVKIQDLKINSKGKCMNRAESGTLSLKLLLINYMGSVEDDLLDFVESCLHWIPSQRITAMEGLEHPWICSRVNQPQRKLKSISPNTTVDKFEE